MTSTETQDLSSVVLLVLVAIVLFPFLTMGLGFGGMMTGGMMGGSAMGSGTLGGWSLLGWIGQLAIPLVLLWLGYRFLTRFAGGTAENDSALAELRRAYARGDLSDEEFARRRERLENDG